jgi:uncharacterized peroxidase-related enzyme
MRSWIEVVLPAEARGRLKKIYERISGPKGTIDNILMVHSLRPHTLEGHMALYKSVLHHSRNTLPRWFLELVGVYVSLLNGCDYCVRHHSQGLRYLLGDDKRATELLRALESGKAEEILSGREQAALDYARVLTLHADQIDVTFITTLRAAGLSDGEILELNQVVSYFAYANRTVLGLGVTTEGDTLGLSPSDAADPDNWHHQ